MREIGRQRRLRWPASIGLAAMVAIAVGGAGLVVQPDQNLKAPADFRGLAPGKPLKPLAEGGDTVRRFALQLLQDDGALSNAALGEKLSLSVTPCWRRRWRTNFRPSRG